MLVYSASNRVPPAWGLGEGPLIAVKTNVLRGVAQGIEYMGF